MKSNAFFDPFYGDIEELYSKELQAMGAYKQLPCPPIIEKVQSQISEYFDEEDQESVQSI